MLSEPNSVQVHRGINRNILECKAAIGGNSSVIHSVLIETYWNVKILITGKAILKEHVLIETYWNVKILANIGEQPIYSINRNILECKAMSLTSNTDNSFVLIETYWNVKFIALQQ